VSPVIMPVTQNALEPWSVLIPKASDPYRLLCHFVLGQLGYSVSRNSSILTRLQSSSRLRYGADRSCKLLLRHSLVCTLTLDLQRFRHRCHVALYKRRLVEELYINVDLSRSFRSWTASSSFELDTDCDHLLVVRPVAVFLTACNVLNVGNRFT
jgi:hypothetical protein